MTTDRIEKTIFLNAPVAKVWRAISDAGEFGRWFGMSFDGGFATGAKLTGTIVMTEVDPDIAKAQKPHVGKSFEIWIETLEPERQVSFRWHPFAIDTGADYSKEPTTLVVFNIAPEEKGTRLTITESGFDRIPLQRRAAAFAANDGGWQAQTQLLKKYLANYQDG
jgi:uncharacterized protein YndB with AHSA1/START domain